MQSQYLGRIPFRQALDVQLESAERVRAGAAGVVLGFESEPVVTLGLRGCARSDLVARDWPIVVVDRGGQATLHNPGQLVIFPVCPLGSLGTRAWVDLLIDVTRGLASTFGQTLEWRDEAPGLWGEGGKVVSLGLRIRRGISTHGLSINVRNSLEDFARIRTCGVANAALAHWSTDLALDELFVRWVDALKLRISVT